MQSQRNIRLLAWFNFLLDFRLYAPVMIIYFERVTGSYALAMGVLSITTLSAALFEVPTGVISDRIGRKWTAVAGAVASMFAVVSYAIGGAFAVLAIGGVLEGLSRSFFSGNNDALLHDTLSETNATADYQLHLGRVSSMFQFALAVSALVGSVIADISFALVMWLSVIPQAGLVIVSLRFVEPQIHKAESVSAYAHLREALRNIMNNPRLRALSAGHILQMSIGEATFQFRTVFIETLWPLWAIGAARTISNISAAFSFYFAGSLIRRFGQKRLLLGGITLAEFVNLFALVLNNVLSPVFQGLTSLVFGVNKVSINGLKQREFTQEQRATMGSLVEFGSSLLFAVASLLLGWLADQIGVRDALIVSTLLSFGSVWFYSRAFRLTGRAGAEPIPTTADGD
jgi:MFS family permease